MDLHPDTYLGRTPVKLLAGFCPDDRRAFLSNGRVCEYHLHERIMREDDPDLHLYVVLTGGVSVWRQDVQVATMRPGDVLNETKIFLPRPNHATAVAEEHTAVLRLTRTEVLRFFSLKPERLLKIYVLNIVTILSQKLEASEDQIIGRHLQALPLVKEM